MSLVVEFPNDWMYCQNFCAIWLFNEADTHKPSSILIYSQLQTSLYTDSGQREAVLIKMVIKLGELVELMKVD